MNPSVLPDLPDEIIGRVLAFAGESSPKRLKKTHFPKDVVAYADMGYEDLFNPLRDSLRGILQRLKAKTLEVDGRCNSYSWWDESHLWDVPDTLLSAWPRHHAYQDEEIETPSEKLVLTSSFCEAVAGDLEWTLVTTRVHSRSLWVYPTGSPPHIGRVALKISECVGNHDSDDMGFNLHERELSLVFQVGDNQYDVRLKMEGNDDPDHFYLCVRGPRRNERKREDAGLVADMVQTLLRTQEAPYLSLHVFVDPSISTKIEEVCAEYGVLPFKQH